MTAGRVPRAVLALLAWIFLMDSTAPALSRTDIVEGNRASSVKVYIYEDLQCADCARFRTMLDEKLLPKYGSRVAFIHRDFPLGKHDWARQAAIAARWIYEQNQQLGIVFRQQILSEQDHITTQNLKPWLTDFANRNHLSEKDLLASLSDLRLSTLVDQDRQLGEARGVSKAPTVIADGQVFAETIIYDDLARTLDQALSK
jgi:protein-disulfide isomerase